MTQILWTPSPESVAVSAMTEFAGLINERHGQSLEDSTDLYRWSINDIPTFWDDFWDFCGIKGTKGGIVLANPHAMPGAQFFPEATLNYAENLLERGRNPKDIAIHFWGEDKVKRQITFQQLNDQVSQIQQFFKDEGVTVGDRVAAFMPNIPETIIAMLAATSIGATWSSASPDFGVQGVLDRFGQIEPKILVCVDGYYYNGKWVDCRAKLEEIIPQIPSLKAVILVSYHPDTTIDPIGTSTVWSHVLDIYKPRAITYTPVPFNHPLFIMFSSGTTGKPKCIVHGTGGTLIQHLKEHQLHCDVKPNDNVFYFTTCGWMMWNWQVSALASRATLSLYDGSPFAPNGAILFDYCDAVGITLFGVGAKYIDALKKQDANPKATHTLEAMRTITSTGSPLVDEGFKYVYECIKQDVHLASISGGTDIVSCFMLGDPTKPVYSTELQTAGMGLAVDVYTQEGTPASVGEKGELVCTQPFPCMPVAFWNDADGSKYKKAYFERFPGIWHHGDFVEKTAQGGFVIHGRSDATLKPSGVRIGTAEIYAQVEHLSEVVECVAIGQKWNDDERVVLFVVLKPGLKLNDDLITKIKKQVRSGASPHHVPSKILQVADIPRTKNNKISEIAVRDTVNGMSVANTEALSNPEALALYRDLPELKQA
jgi:acetoacetyl-CoA synthetase